MPSPGPEQEIASPNPEDESVSETKEDNLAPKKEEEVDFFTTGWPKGRTPTHLNKDYATYLLRGTSFSILP